MRRLRIDIVDTVSRKREQFVFASSPVKVGRGRACDLVLEFDFVSQLHAAISFSDAEAVFMDLGSSNASVIDGVKAKKNRSVRLSPSARIVIGTLALTLSWPSEEEKDPPAPGTGKATFSPLVDPLAAQVPRPATPRNPTRVLDEAVVAAALGFELVAADKSSRSAPPATALPEPSAPPSPSPSSVPPGSDVSSSSAISPALGSAGPAGRPADSSPSLVSSPGSFLPEITPPASSAAGAASVNASPPAWSPSSLDALPDLPDIALPWSTGDAGGSPSIAPPAVLPLAPDDGPNLEPSVGPLTEAFARNFAELRLGFSNVAEDLGLPSLSLPGPLGAWESGDDLLACLTARPDHLDASSTELRRAFAFLHAHHVSVVGGLRECIDELLSREAAGCEVLPARVADVASAFRFAYRSIMAGQGFAPETPSSPSPSPSPSLAPSPPVEVVKPQVAKPQPLYPSVAPTPLSTSLAAARGSNGPPVDGALATVNTSRRPIAPPPRPVGGTVELNLEADGGSLPAVHTLTNLGEDPAQTFVLGKARITIGRVDDTDLPLRHAAVSRLHAEITRDPSDHDGWLATDLGSSNGTFVNGSPIKSVRLKPGDIIQIGPVQLRFA